MKLLNVEKYNLTEEQLTKFGFFYIESPSIFAKSPTKIWSILIIIFYIRDYSLLSASTGSRLEADLDGISPAMYVRNTEIPISTSAAPIGSLIIRSTLNDESTTALIGILTR